MKHIVKGDEPDFLKEWKRENRKANWDDFSKPDTPYQDLKKMLIEEQGKLCCYCEIALKEEVHIEHFKPKSSYPKEMFNIQNLFACCQENEHCGHKKLGKYFEQLISPLDVECETRFTYTKNGKIIPTDEDDIFAQKTIDLLNLNHRELQDQRRSIIQTLGEEWVTPDYLKQSLENHFEWWDGFFTVIQYVISNQDV